MTSNPSEWPDKAEKLRLEFKQGIPIKVTNEDTNESYKDSLELFCYLNKIGQMHGVGRIDIVENRFVVMKSRGIYETPGGTILYQAHLDIETLTLDREVRKIKQSLVPRYTECVYNRFWFSPEFDYLSDCIKKNQENLDFLTTKLEKINL